MSLNLEVQEGVITRRTFLKGSAGAVILVITAGSVGSALSACAGPPTKDFTVTSSTDNNHSHKITVIGADVDNPPAEKIYTSDGASHQHTVTLKKADLQAIKKGQEITITSSSAGTTAHTHKFTIKKPAA